MTSVARYAYLRTRVSLMAARLLPRERLDGLIELPPGESEDLLKISRELGLDRGDAATPGGSLEQRLVSALLEDYLILLRPLTGAARELLRYVSHRVELTNLKAIISGKMAGQDPAAIRRELMDMGPFAALPTEDLLRTEDMAELLRRLDSTPYSDITRQARRVFEEQHDLFAIHAAIDRRYFAGLAKRVKAIREPGHQEVWHIVGTWLDRTNLSWLMRLRFAYNLGAAESYYLLIPATYRLGGDRLMALAQLPSFGEVIAHLPHPYGPLLGTAQNGYDVVRILDAETWRLAETTVHRSPSALAAAVAYLLLRERDLRALRAILRGLRLKLPPELIRSAAGLDAPVPA
ncbi:MAG TPA: V-type ATPase subunit [Burkholderiales bacterium]